ncbi:hypothetical protein V8B97DRAFT_1940185 [Scleroderma yunnanense]
MSEPPLFNEHDTTLVSGSKSVSPENPSPSSPNLPTLSFPDSQRSSCPFTRRPPTIRFAPLPKVDPSRRRSIPPLGVSPRSRRKYAPQEGRSLLWAVDPIPEETVEDPILVLGRLVKKAGRKMWQRVKMKGTMATTQEKDSAYASDVIDIKPDELSGDTAASSDGTEEHESELHDNDDKQPQRTSWSAERGTPDIRTLQVRRSTGDLASFSKTSL